MTKHKRQIKGFPIGSVENNLSAMQETWVQSLGWEDSPGEGQGYPLQHSGLENPWGRRVGHDGATLTSLLQ